MYRNIPDIYDAALYARTDMQKLTCEILRIEGIKSLNTRKQNF